MNIDIENQLRETARPLLEKGRPGDFDHTIRVLEIGRYLLKHERGEEDIAIPAIYLHDIGYSKVDFNTFLEDMKQRLRDIALGQWFKTKTARKLAEKWLEDL